MSMNALRWAREPRPGLGGPAAAVLRDLADRASESGVCWPSVQTIASSTGYCMRTVQYALRRLETDHLIATKQTGRGSRYTLNLPPEGCKSCTSEVQELQVRGARAAPKASRSESEARPAAGAYAPAPPPAAPETVDEVCLELARGWLQEHPP